MKKAMLNLSPDDTPEGIAGNVANVLSFLTYVLANQNPETELALNAEESEGLWLILSACEGSLKRIR